MSFRGWFFVETLVHGDGVRGRWWLCLTAEEHGAPPCGPGQVCVSDLARIEYRRIKAQYIAQTSSNKFLLSDSLFRHAYWKSLLSFSSKTVLCRNCVGGWIPSQLRDHSQGHQAWQVRTSELSLWSLFQVNCWVSATPFESLPRVWPFLSCCSLSSQLYCLVCMSVHIVSHCIGALWNYFVLAVGFY